jgi:hypothetical protein
MAEPREPAAIRAGIERARQEIEQSMRDLRRSFSWRSFVRRHPVGVFSGALALGLLVARATSR